MNIDKSILSKLTGEQKKKAEAARTPEELLAFAKESGYELTLEEISKVSGGTSDCPHYQHGDCPGNEEEYPAW